MLVIENRFEVFTFQAKKNIKTNHVCILKL
jgi:hypothetical protein